jgi:transcriptional regulator with XRE-family HTH domain
MNSIRDARIKMGLSQKELARNAGIDARTLRKIENGNHVSEVSLHAVERELGVSACENVLRTPKGPIVTAQGFLIGIIGYYAALFGVGWLLHVMESQAWMLVVALAAMSMIFIGPLYLVGFGPDRGNTCIKIKAPLSRANDVANPLEMAKGLLGRDDVMVGHVEFDGASFGFVAFADYEFREYPSLIAKLKNLGVDATVSSAA